MKKSGNDNSNNFFDNLDEFYSNQEEINGNKKENENLKEEIDGNSKSYFNGDYEYYTEYYDPGSVMESYKKCECGADCANLLRHSNWCPKFEKWMENS